MENRRQQNFFNEVENFLNTGILNLTIERKKVLVLQTMHYKTD